jgi:CRISPR-associated endonuclease/helicase Cas3
VPAGLLSRDGHVSTPEFARFFETVYGYRAFPWQDRLAQRVLSGGGWPTIIAVPTAAGKTAVIDIAVFALACSVARSPGGLEPRRIFFVVDRRIVVDAAFERAKRLSEALAAASQGIVREVAEHLTSLGGDVPLQVARLRGGMFLDHGWAQSPAQPLVCVSTVDQVGSRLLFRGYGLSTGATNLLPVHAALVGSDALIVLDEAHLSRPFADTLAAVSRYSTWAEQALRGPCVVVRMTATPGPDSGEVFSIGSDDRADPELARRLRARKRARMVEVSTQKAREAEANERGRREEGENRARLVEALCSEARSVLERDADARVVGVVVNRVATARAVWGGLRRTNECVLLMGPVRPWDRDRLLERYLPRIRAGRERSSMDAVLFVVATQCIETGADIDLDAVITECASLDALRQRFGRLDRLGRKGESRAAIVARHDHVAKGAEDPVYGESLAHTWQWLTKRARSSRNRRARDETPSIDMGISSLDRLASGAQLLHLIPPARRAPVMLPAHLDLWVQTSPIPLPDPDPGLFLHGPKTEPPDVLIVWRADLDPENPGAWRDTVTLVPPTSVEALPVPIYVIRRWLERVPEADFSDVEGTALTDHPSPSPGRLGLRWRGPQSEDTKPVAANDVRPGDTIIVPASYGGADQFGWNPESSEPVRDIADGVALAYRKRPVLRLHPDAIRPLLSGASEEIRGRIRGVMRRLQEALDSDDTRETEEAMLQALVAAEGTDQWLVAAARALLADVHRRRIVYPDGRGLVLLASHRLSSAGDGGEGIPDSSLTDEDDATSFTSPVSLGDHSRCVADEVRRLATVCGLPSSLVKDLVTAAYLHDVGKADPRFQVMLHAGDGIAAELAPEPLAKSGMDPRDRQVFKTAFQRSGLPPGYRHEATSLALLEATPAVLIEAADPDLVLHLVASHHGAARPLLPAVPDEDVEITIQQDGALLRTRSAHGLARTDSGVADRFWRLVRRYGWWGLVHIEAILRLADHRVSAKEAGDGGVAT